MLWTTQSHEAILEVQDFPDMCDLDSDQQYPCRDIVQSTHITTPTSLSSDLDASFRYSDYKDHGNVMINSSTSTRTSSTGDQPTDSGLDTARSLENTKDVTDNKRKQRSRKYLDDEEKRKSFLERNRQAALKCRLRKKQWLKDLQIQAEYLTTDNEQLQMHICALQDEIVHLRSVLVAHRDCSVSTGGVYPVGLYTSTPTRPSPVNTQLPPPEGTPWATSHELPTMKLFRESYPGAPVIHNTQHPTMLGQQQPSW